MIPGHCRLLSSATFKSLALKNVKMLSIQICHHVDLVHQTVIPAYDLVGIILANIDKAGVVPLFFDSTSAVVIESLHPRRAFSFRCPRL
jgi:hypothetical protein